MRRLASPNISDAFVQVENDLEKVLEVIDTELSDCDDSFIELVHSCSLSNGKMIRPVLVLLSASLCGQINRRHHTAAAVVQILHQATLLHDDVIDNAKTRRGKPTVNVLYGNESAVLLGDLLLSKALKLSAQLPSDFVSRFALTACNLCQGELMQSAEKKNWHISESQYFDIIAAKSASLFSLCCYSGASFADAPKAQIDALQLFGNNIGIAFQIADDILDITGDQTKLGKTLGTDMETSKITLPMIHLLLSVSETQQAEIINVLTKQRKPADIQWLNNLLREHKSFEYSQQAANRCITEAIESLDVFEDSPAKRSLITIAHFTIDRQQ